MSKKISPVQYLEMIGIKVSKEVEPLITTSWELDSVMDASYMYDTDNVSLNQFNVAMAFRHDYFNGNIDDSNEFADIDLSESVTANLWHYTFNDLLDNDVDEKCIVEVDLNDESRFYETY